MMFQKIISFWIKTFQRNQRLLAKNPSKLRVYMLPYLLRKLICDRNTELLYEIATATPI